MYWLDKLHIPNHLNNEPYTEVNFSLNKITFEY